MTDWTLTGKTPAGVNITAVAASGLDLYARTDAGRWHWLGIGRPTQFPQNTDALMTEPEPDNPLQRSCHGEPVVE